MQAKDCPHQVLGTGLCSLGPDSACLPGTEPKVGCLVSPGRAWQGPAASPRPQRAALAQAHPARAPSNLGPWAPVETLFHTDPSGGIFSSTSASAKAAGQPPRRIVSAPATVHPRPQPPTSSQTAQATRAPRSRCPVARGRTSGDPLSVLMCSRSPRPAV